MSSIILLVIAAILNGIMDMIYNMRNISIFSNIVKYNPIFWDPTLSWRNKWKNPDAPIHERKEKFFGSSTFLVWTTDAWHLYKMLFLSVIIFAITPSKLQLFDITIYWYITWPIFSIIWGIFFELTLKIFTKKS